MAKTKGEGGETRANCGYDARTRFIKPWPVVTICSYYCFLALGTYETVVMAFIKFHTEFLTTF